MIDRDADEKEIEEAYRKRVKETHPDRGGSPEEFQLVQSAYEEIKSGSRNQRTTAKGQRQNDSQSEQILRCSKCNSPIQNVSNATYEQKTGEVFCPDCIVNTHCRICGRDLLLSINQFSAVDGNPVCKSCDQKRQTAGSKTGRQAETSRSHASTDQTASSNSTPVWLYFLVGLAISLIVFWYFRPTFVVTLSPETVDTLRNAVQAVAGPGILILLWALWKK